VRAVLLAATASLTLLASAQGTAAATPAPVKVSTSLSTRSIRFGAAITARVVVSTNERQLKSPSFQLTTRFGSWEQLAPARVTTAEANGRQVRTWSYTIACLVTSCLPNGSPLRLELPAVVVAATAADGSHLLVRSAWPPISITQRYSLSTKGALPPFKLDQSLPPATYRAGPTALGDGLDAAAAILALLGLGTAAHLLWRRRDATASSLTPLARALALVRQARERPADDRRIAAGLLARVLRAPEPTPL